MRVSVIIPALNEVETIGEVLKSIPKRFVDEILVIDGHSTDGTIEIVKNLGHSLIPQNGKGFGLAIDTGVNKAKGDIVIIMNADNSHDPGDIPKLLKKIEQGYDLVMASRYIPGAGSDDDTLVHYIGNKFFTALCNIIHKTNLSDSLYFYLAAKREIFETISLESRGVDYCIELPVKAQKSGFKIVQVPSFERKRSGGRAKINAFYDGLKILRRILSLYIIKNPNEHL